MRATRVAKSSIVSLLAAMLLASCSGNECPTTAYDCGKLWPATSHLRVDVSTGDGAPRAGAAVRMEMLADSLLIAVVSDTTESAGAAHADLPYIHNFPERARIRISVSPVAPDTFDVVSVEHLVQLDRGRWPMLIEVAVRVP